MIEWEDKYSVSISTIDEEHKKLIGIINKTIIAKEHNANPEEIEEVLKEIADYDDSLVVHLTNHILTGQS